MLPLPCKIFLIKNGKNSISVPKSGIIWTSSIIIGTITALVVGIVCNEISTVQIGRQHKRYVHNPANHHRCLRSQLSNKM